MLKVVSISIVVLAVSLYNLYFYLEDTFDFEIVENNNNVHDDVHNEKK